MKKVKGLTQEQYDAAVKKYPIPGQLYSLLKEFHRIVFSQKSKELDGWLVKSSRLNIDEINTYVSRLKSDLDAVKDGIQYKYNNGLAEGTVNKIKLIK